MLATRFSAIGLVSAALVALCAGCNPHNDAVPVSCGVPGLVQSCTCPTGMGTQACQTSGAWQLCNCPSGSGASAGTAGQGASGSTGTGQAGNGTAGNGGSGGSAGTAGAAGAGGGGTGGTAGTQAIVDGGTHDGGGAGGADASTTDPALYKACQNSQQCGPGHICNNKSSGGILSGLCTKSCMKKDDCPTPATGTAIPVCTNQTCALDCGGTHSECPAGLTCFTWTLGGAGGGTCR
ncbi:MAG TPA: hypothetical protein VF331_21065 [Polyangiales bacterium]